MKRTNVTIRMGLALLAVAALSAPRLCLAQAGEGNPELGRELFDRQFEATEPGDLSGDGLGPVFNHVSCAACHKQGGLGGAGPVDVNAAMLSVDLTRLESRSDLPKLARRLREIHPGFVGENGEVTPSILLHRFGTDPRYAALRAGLVGSSMPFNPSDSEREGVQKGIARQPLQPAKLSKGIAQVVVSQRNTTPLFGAGLIDQIPDAALQAVALAQTSHPEVSGRVAPIGLNKAGRFGWRGQTEHLHDFVLGACANELGLNVPGTPQPMDPLRPDYKPVSLDLSATECNSLTAFVASLPQPKLMLPENFEQLEVVTHGEKVFASVGCAVCHMQDLGPAQRLYSDLLLHDMGPALADPVLAKATLVPTKQQLTFSSSILTQPGTPTDVVRSQPQYYGGAPPITAATFATDSAATTFRSVDRRTALKTEFNPVPTNLAQEWRTPPLWGLADSAPYVHDGRAETVVEAIALHGGEAEGAMKRFFSLSIADRMAMLQFLSCLKAPQ